ncbi:replicative helicase loader/inhibitor [Listeria fleischmannii]|uniref:Uncharacterized protein n=1 Tax=Listeria fleischmannii FSL S10-1203 TaxID=1265822 RepID=W7CZW1_9LIST|nr:replicative helicase loader/inhibitor [Listeria fleischmannii]EUJ42477.1 hypothetical protein MCOL2_20962 [Listeria fleischmannii FSL S10-1203]
MNQTQALQLIEKIAAAYPRFKDTCTESVINLWIETLKEADFTKSSLALERHIKTKKFPPNIADIFVSSQNTAEQAYAEMDTWKKIEEKNDAEMSGFSTPELEDMPLSDEIKAYIQKNRRKVKTPFVPQLSEEEAQERIRHLQNQAEALRRHHVD